MKNIILYITFLFTISSCTISIKDEKAINEKLVEDSLKKDSIVKALATELSKSDSIVDSLKKHK